MAHALALGRLLRISLAPSAPADIAAGCVLAASALPGGSAFWCALVASSCVYHGGLALNDWADRAADASARPGRPIPSGAVPAGLALALACSLLVAGPALAYVGARPAALPLALVAALAVLYDLAGRGRWRGPLLLAACRAGNLSAGLALGAGSLAFARALWLAPLAYGLYVFLVSCLARLEDRSEEELARERPARWLALAAGALLVLGVAAVVIARGRGVAWPIALLPLLPVAGGVVLPARLAWERRARAWSARELEQAAGVGLRRLLVASAALALGAGSAGLPIALVILCGYPLAFALRRVFPPS